MGILADAPLLTAPAPGDLTWVYDISTPSTPDKSMQLAALAELFLQNKVFMVDASFDELGSAWNRYTLLSSALTAAAAAGGGIIFVAPGTYAGSPITADNIAIVGSGKPLWDGTTMTGGTIFTSRINTGAYANIILRDFGVHVTVNDFDCIGSSAVGIDVNRTYENLTLVGNGGAASAHGIYASGNKYNIKNVDVYDCYHGIAIHGATNLDGFYIYRCTGTSLIIKAKNSAPLSGVNVVNGRIEGDPSAGTSLLAGPIELQTADSTALSNVNIVNVYTNYMVNCAVYIHLGDTTGSIRDVTITNVKSDNNRNLATLGDFHVRTGVRIAFIGCNSTNRNNGYGFVRTVTTEGTPDVSLIGCAADSSGSGAYSGTFTTLMINGGMPTLAGDNVYTGSNEFQKSTGLKGSKSGVANNTATNLCKITVTSSLDLSFACIVNLTISQGTSLSNHTFLYNNAWAIENMVLLGEAKFNVTSCSITATMNTSTRESTISVTQVSGAAARVDVTVVPLGIAQTQGLTLAML